MRRNCIIGRHLRISPCVRLDPWPQLENKAAKGIKRQLGRYTFDGWSQIRNPCNEAL